MYWVLGYCSVMWLISAWSTYHAVNDDPIAFEFRRPDHRMAAAAAALALIVLFAPIWMPIAFIQEWREE